MGVIGLMLLLLTVLFITLFFIPRYRESDIYQIISGVVEVVMTNLVLFFLLFMLAALVAPNFTVNFFYGIAVVGLLQLLYVVPRSLFLKRQQRWSRLKGVIIGAVIVALLNGGCWLLFAQMAGV
jgi:hypothetical protein